MRNETYYCPFCDHEITHRGVRMCQGCNAEISWPTTKVWVAALQLSGGVLIGGATMAAGVVGMFRNRSYDPSTLLEVAGAILILLAFWGARYSIPRMQAGLHGDPTFHRPSGFWSFWFLKW